MCVPRVTVCCRTFSPPGDLCSLVSPCFPPSPTVIRPCLRMSFTRNVLFCDWPLSLRVMFLSFVRHCSFYKYLCTNTHSHLFHFCPWCGFYKYLCVQTHTQPFVCIKHFIFPSDQLCLYVLKRAPSSEAALARFEQDVMVRSCLGLS